MREEAFTRAIPPGMNRHKYVMYRFRQALVEAESFDLIAMGQPEGSGCYCFANDLLSECMQQLERDYRFVVIDSEAGMEHIARGTIGKPDMLLIVSDPGARALRTITRIREIAVQLGTEREKIQVVINRFHSGTAIGDTGSENPIAFIPDDPAIESADLDAKPVSLIPKDNPARIRVRDLAKKIIEMGKLRKEITVLKK
ncbi:MAG: CobQ/CobB/MinD/ParA nucleotide binding domain protein [Methanoregula sp. PtaU1.Bin051]|nr:MAG: CobQ/CobB/MinD/ParA nucleotide binding domain protein [Methanoregula sp. PtaU1.Bin051]